MQPIAKASITKYWELLKLFFYSKPPAAQKKKKKKEQKQKRHLKIDAFPLSRVIRIQIWRTPIRKGVQIQCTRLHEAKKKNHTRGKKKKKQEKRTDLKQQKKKSVIATVIIYVYVSEDIYTVYISTVHTCIHTHICINLKQIMHASH